MDALDRLGEWLEQHGCCGLSCGECTCEKGNLMQCGDPSDRCAPVAKVVYGGGDV